MTEGELRVLADKADRIAGWVRIGEGLNVRRAFAEIKDPKHLVYVTVLVTRQLNSYNQDLLLRQLLKETVEDESE